MPETDTVWPQPPYDAKFWEERRQIVKAFYIKHGLSPDHADELATAAVRPETRGENQTT